MCALRRMHRTLWWRMLHAPRNDDKEVEKILIKKNLDCKCLLWYHNKRDIFSTLRCIPWTEFLREVNTIQEDKWPSMKKVCVYLHISRDIAMNWIKEGMPAHQNGLLWCFDVNEVNEWMKNNDPENISDAKEFLN